MARRAVPAFWSYLGLALAVLAFAQPAAHAASGNWNADADGNWSDATKWSSNPTAPGTAASDVVGLTFNITAARGVTIDTTSRTVGTLNIGDPATTFFAYTLAASGGAGLTFNNSGSTANLVQTVATASDLISAPITLADNLYTYNSSTLTLSGTIGDGGAVKGITKTGTGTLTLNGAAVNTFTGGLTLNGGTLLADFANLGSTPNLIDSGNTLALGGGILTVKGKGATFTAAQTLGNVTVNAGGGRILGNNNGSTSTTITLGTLTATAAGGSLLVGTAAANTTGLTITTMSGTLVNGIYGGRVVWFNGTANTGYDWATTASGGSPYTFGAYGTYTAMVDVSGTDALNDTTGTLTLAAGSQTHNSLKLTSGATLALGANLLTLTSGGLLSVGNAGSTISGTVGATRLTAGNGSGAYDLIIHQFNSGGLTIGAVIGNNGANATTLTKTGSGQLNLSGTNTYTGGTFINAGTLYSSTPQNNSALGGAGSVNVTIAAGATFTGERSNIAGSLTLNGGTWTENNGFGGSWTGPVTLGANSIITSGYNQTINGNVSGPGGLTHTGNGTLTLNGANAYAGPTIISAGTVAFPTPASLYNAEETSWTAANITVASGATLRLTVGGTGFTDTQVGTLLGNLLTVNNNGLKAGSAFGFDTASGSAAVSTAVTDSTGSGGGTVGVKKFSANTLTLSGANTYTGPTTVGGGTLQAGVATVANTSGAFGINSAVTDGAGATLDLAGFDTQIGSLTGAGNVTLGAATLTIGGNDTSPAAYSGVISGAGNLTKIGTGALTLTGANTYTGVTTIAAGIVNLGRVETVNTSGPLGKQLADAAGTIVLGGGTLQYSAANQNDYSGRFGPAANQAYNVDTANQTVPWATALTSPGGTLTKTGAGTLTLSGANTYSGATTNNGGTLKAGVASVPNTSGAFGNNSAVTLANTAAVVLDITGFDTQIGSLTGGGATGGNVTLGAATLTIGGDNTSTAYAGVLSGAGGSLTKIGTGTLTLNNTDTYSGNTTVSGGTLALGSSGALANTAGIALAAGATCDLSLVASPYTLGNSSTLSASGTDLTTGAATLKGPAGGTIDLNSRPITLNFTPTGFAGDGTHPALSIAQGDLTANSVVITLTNNAASPLDVGTYTLITNVTGIITGTPSLAGGTVGGQGIVSGRGAAIALSGDGKAINLVVSAGGIPTTITLARHAGTGDTNTYGDSLSFDVTVSAGEGVVTLHDGGATGTAIGAGTLAGGACTITAYLNGLTAGTHDNVVAVYGGDAGHLASTSDPLAPAQTVGPKGLTLTGAAGNNKLYDGTAAATLSGSLDGVVAGDTATEVYFVGTGTFDNGGAVGTGLAVTAAATLGGTKAASYTILAQPTGLFADILSRAAWTQLASGLNWSTADNWRNNLVGRGADVTADFNTLNITGGVTVHLDLPQTIGGLIFGDTVTGSAGSWTLDNNGQAINILTMAGTAPTITASGAGVTIGHELSLATNVTVEVAASGPLSLSGLISGAGGLTKNGSGALTISYTTNTYSGETIINSGTLNSTVGGGANGGFGTGAVTINSGATIIFAGAGPNVRDKGTFNGGTIIAANGFGAAWSGPVTLNSNTTFEAVYGMSFGGSISGAGGFTKTGGNTLTISGSNTFAGAIAVNVGTLQVASLNGVSNGTPTSNLGAPTTVAEGTISLGSGATGGTLLYKGTNETSDRVIDLAGATGGAVLDQSGPGGLLKFTSAFTATGVGAKTLTLQGSTAGTGELGGAIVDSTGGATTLLKAGTGTWILSGANTYSGETRITAGTLSLASRASLRAGTDVHISSGATIDLNYTGTIFIHALFINGEFQPPGYYGANNHSPFITGTGVLATPLHGAVLVVR